MSFDFGGGFSFGSGFSMAGKPSNPLDSVEYTDDVSADSLAEYDALFSAMDDVAEEYNLVLVFPSREPLESFMWRRHLDKKQRFHEGAKAVRALSTPQASDAFSVGSGFSLKGGKKVDASEGWVERNKAEKKRFTLATDPEYYCVIYFESAEDLEGALVKLGLSGVERLPIDGAVCMSGPVVDGILP